LQNPGVFGIEAPRAWLISTVASSAEFVSQIERWTDVMKKDFVWNLGDEVIKAARQRLVRDPLAREKFLAVLESTQNHDLIASGSRFLGATTSDRRALFDWWRRQLDQLAKIETIQPQGYESWNNQIRPLEFSIKDACLTH